MRAAFILLFTSSLALAHPPVLERELPRPLTRVRTEIRIPNPVGFLTLKCDFHIHTVFSDGTVWPSVRAEEAWREGLDAIAITDHIEYQPHQKEIPTNHNRSFEIASGAGSSLDLIVLRGSEITRNMPPGHLNAVFLADCAALAVTEWKDAIKAAHDQRAFIFWNHPGWDRQAANGIAVWYPEHSQLLETGMLHGIEVVNGRSYYPEAHRWAIEKNLAIFANSDIHAPMHLDYHLHEGDLRPVTLVFAKERSAESIREALEARRSAAFSGGFLIGAETFLRPVFEKSLRLKNPRLTLRGKGRALVQIANDSSIDYFLQREAEPPGIEIPEEVTLPAGKTALLEVKGAGTAPNGEQSLSLPYSVRNLLVGPDEALSAGIALTVTFAGSP
jgi:hypothetical protein